MKDSNSKLPESIRIKYCIKGDKHYRLYNCLLDDLNYDKLLTLIQFDISYSIKMSFCSSSIKEEKIVSSKKEFEDFLISTSFSLYYDAKYNCLKIHFIKEMSIKIIKTEQNIDKYKDLLITDISSSISLDFMLNNFKHNEIAKNQLYAFLKENKLIPINCPQDLSDNLLIQLLQIIRENYDAYVNTKSSLGKLKLDVSLQNLEENNNSGISEYVSFSNIYNINELNLVSNDDLIRDSTIFRTKTMN